MMKMIPLIALVTNQSTLPIINVISVAHVTQFWRPREVAKVSVLMKIFLTVLCTALNLMIPTSKHKNR